MECDINIVGCHCSHKHHFVPRDVVSVTVMQNVKTFFGAQKRPLLSISRTKDAGYAIN